MSTTVFLQLVPGLGLTIPGLLTTIVVAVIVLLALRFLLSVALKLAILAAIVVGVLWLLGALTIFPFHLVPA